MRNVGGTGRELGGVWPRWLPRWAREAGLVGAIYLAYEVCRGFQQGSTGIASRNGWDILRWERSLDLAPEHLLSQALIHVTPLAVLAAYFYSTMHYVITPVVLVWMYRGHPDHYRTARTSLAISTLIGLVVFYLVPTAPPRLLRGAGIPDALSDVRNWGWWGGDGSVPRGLGGITNQFAAMPSLHVGWAIWCGFLVARYASRTWVRLLGALYPLVTALVVLSTGNHYLLDAVAGGVVMVIGAGLALLGNLVRARRDGRPARPVPLGSGSVRSASVHSGPPRAARRRVASPVPGGAAQWTADVPSVEEQPGPVHACLRR